MLGQNGTSFATPPCIITGAALDVVEALVVGFVICGGCFADAIGRAALAVAGGRASDADVADADADADADAISGGRSGASATGGAAASGVAEGFGSGGWLVASVGVPLERGLGWVVPVGR